MGGTKGANSTLLMNVFFCLVCPLLELFWLWGGYSDQETHANLILQLVGINMQTKQKSSFINSENFTLCKPSSDTKRSIPNGSPWTGTWYVAM